MSLMNHFHLLGRIEKLESTPASGLMWLSYGPNRALKGHDLRGQFVNACVVRVSKARMSETWEQLQVGMVVGVHGHLQGIIRAAGPKGPTLGLELAASHIQRNPVDWLELGTEAEATAGQSEALEAAR